MPRTPVANINADVLRWARERLGVSRAVAAKRIGVTPERLASWEAGEAKPTISQLRAAAKLFQRPLAVFFMSEPPRSIDTRLKDFRRLPDSDDGVSADLAREIQRALSQREVMLDLAEELGDQPIAFGTLSIPSDSSSEAAETIRRLLGVTLAEQAAWRDAYEALAGWVGAVEARGVLVIQTSRVPLAEARGFSISESVLPVVALNGADAPRGKIFTLIHEFAHVLLNAGGVCDLHERGRRGSPDVEVYCNQVAAETLLPHDAFTSEELVRAELRDEEWTDELLDVLSRRYGVSREVVLRRLLSIGLVSAAHYRSRRDEFVQSYAASRAESSGGPPFHVMRLRDLGRPFVSTVLEAYRSDLIGSADASGYLGVRVKLLPKLEESLHRRSRS